MANRVTKRVFSQMTRCGKLNQVPGIDRSGYVGPHVILVKYGRKEMWKVPGARYSNNGGRQYVAGEVILVPDADSRWRLGYHPDAKAIYLDKDSGRVSRKKITEWADRIDEFFGTPVAHLIDPKTTVWVEEER